MQKGKKIHRPGQQCGDCRVEGDMRTTGNGKTKTKNNQLNSQSHKNKSNDVIPEKKKKIIIITNNNAHHSFAITKVWHVILG